MNACVENRDEILKFYQYAIDNFDNKRIDINLNRMIKFHEKDKFQMLDIKEYAKLFLELQVLLDKKSGKFRLPTPRKIICKFISGSAYSISPDGLCNLCSGSVENGKITFKEVDINKKAAVELREECKKCKFVPLCLGGCIVQHDVGAGCCTYEKYCIDDILKYYIMKRGTV